MIYIHAENLGLYHDLVSTLSLEEATAKDFSWGIRLSTEDTARDIDTTVVEMPDDMALSLFWWYCNKEANNQLLIHLNGLLNRDSMKNKIIKKLEFSVATLTSDRNNKVFGREIKCPEAYMANEIEDEIEYAHPTELYALLDAKGFEKKVEE